LAADEREDDQLDDAVIDRMMELAQDDDGWQPGEQARVEQSKRKTVPSKGDASRSIFPLAKKVGLQVVFDKDTN